MNYVSKGKGMDYLVEYDHEPAVLQCLEINKYESMVVGSLFK